MLILFFRNTGTKNAKLGRYDLNRIHTFPVTLYHSLFTAFNKYKSQ